MGRSVEPCGAQRERRKKYYMCVGRKVLVVGRSEDSGHAERLSEGMQLSGTTARPRSRMRMRGTHASEARQMHQTTDDGDNNQVVVTT